MSAAVTADNTLTRQLWHIAGGGDLEQLDELLNQGVDVNAGDRSGVTALMRAAYHGQLGMVRALIGYGADPNAKDRSGLTALMMAKHGGHDEIVEALRSVGAQGEGARKSRLVASVTEENVDVPTELDEWESGKQDVDSAMEYDDLESSNNSQSARTLHEPPEIWEMVHTTQPESYSPSARRRRAIPTKVLALGASALIFCAVAVFGFLSLRGAISASDNAPQHQPEATAQQPSVSKSLTKTPGKIARSSNELTKLKPVGELTSESADAPRAASSVSSTKRSSASQRPKATKVSANIPKPNKNVRRATKLGSEQDASSKSAKKDPAPVSDPVKPATTQKPKVIPWP